MSLTDGLILLYNMEEADSADRVDEQGSGFDLTELAATITQETGKLGFASGFDGIARLGNSGAPPWLGLDALTIAAWIFPQDIGNGQQAMVNASYTGQALAFSFRWANSSGGFTASIIDDSASSVAASGVAPSNDTWTHYLIEYVRNDFLTVYVNNSAGTPVATNDSPIYTTNTGNSFFVGSRGVSDRFVGRIDQLAVWNRALTGSERGVLYNSGDGALIVDAPRIRTMPAGWLRR